MRGGSPARLFLAILALALVYMAWTGTMRPPTLLDQLRAQGELVVVTRISPSTYYQTRNGPRGIEYDLARRFAAQLGVELRVVVAQGPEQIFELLEQRRAHLAAAGLTVTPRRKQRLMFTRPYMTVRQQLVYRSDQARPDTLLDLEGSLEVVAGSSHAEHLRQATAEIPDLPWSTTAEQSNEELLYRVWNETLRYTVADSNELVLHQRFLPELRAAFDLTPPQGLAWAFDLGEDRSLLHEADAFFQRIRDDGTLAHLIEKYYGHLERFDYVGTRTFMRHITERLPRYRPVFEQAAAASGLDWRLVAAIGYQESHWNPRAISPTGVRGLMMLTLDTAAHVGVENRLDPEQSIRGGARYFAQVRSRIPDRIPEPVRTWLALAAYNVGLGHLEDARILTESQGGNPDSWVDVKKRLPLLSQKKYYQHTRYGYARGWEPVRYVENVRSYYELLIRVTEPELLQLEGPGQEAPAEPLYTEAEPRRVRLSAPLESLY